jgi:hypothetical protein
MGVSLRIYIVNDNDHLHRIPLAKYERLLESNSMERLLKYAGQRVRFASVFIEMVNRKPVEILRIQYAYLKFDSEGRLDQSEMENETRLVFDILADFESFSERDNVINAQQKFAKKQLEDRYRWVPSQKLEASIVTDVFYK